MWNPTSVSIWAEHLLVLFEEREETLTIKIISMVEQFATINAMVIINYTGTAAKSRQLASILSLLINNKTTKGIFFSPSPFEKQVWTDQGQ